MRELRRFILLELLRVRRHRRHRYTPDVPEVCEALRRVGYHGPEGEALVLLGERVARSQAIGPGDCLLAYHKKVDTHARILQDRIPKREGEARAGCRFSG